MWFDVSPETRQFLGLISYLSWTAAYVLMIRRGIKDRTYAFPLIAVCIDVSWELYFSFFSGLDAQYRTPNILWFGANLGVVATCFLYGAEDMPSPVLRKWFRPIFTGGLVAGGLVVFTFIRTFADEYGAISASFAMLIYSVLLPLMLLRRDSLKGQSIYIALGILIGDTVAVPVSLHAARELQTNAPVEWIGFAAAFAVTLHVAYVLLILHVGRRDGARVWRRL